MLKKIQRIERLGVFDDFSWDDEVKNKGGAVQNFGYTDLMVDGAPLPHQPDTIIRWLIDRLRS